MDFVQARQIDGRGGQQGPQSPVGQDHAERSAGQRQDDAFDERLAEQACAAGAECGTDGGIAGASGGARQREVGQIDAEHQQDGSHGRHQKDEALAHVADHALLKRDEAGVKIEAAGELLADGGLYHVELGLGFGGRDAGTEASGG